MELPASEIEYWKDYYNIFPFPQERDDARAARLLEMMNLAAQGKAYKDAKFKDFLPDYLGDTSQQKSLKQQADADKAFASKLMEMQALAKGN